MSFSGGYVGVNEDLTCPVVLFLFCVVKVTKKFVKPCFNPLEGRNW
ncbi:hypothetical protein MCACP_26470 [Neomoorella carbonis]